MKVMATARGITETKLYDHQAVIDRYGIPPALIPDFYGLKGDAHNIPGVPGIGDKTASDLLQQFGSLEEVLARVEEVNGPETPREPRQPCRRRARVQAACDRPAPHRGPRWTQCGRARARARPLAAAGGLPRVRAARPAAPARGGARRRRRGADGSRRRDHGARARGDGGNVAALPAAAELAVVLREPSTPEGELFALSPEWRFGVATDGTVLIGACGGPEDLAAACAERPVVAHDAKALGVVPPGLVHDTMLGAYLLEPARRGFPLLELLEERGLASNVTDETGAQAVLIAGLAARQREQARRASASTRLMTDIELPLVRVLRAMEVEGVRLNVDALAKIAADVRAETGTLEREIWDLARPFLVSRHRPCRSFHRRPQLGAAPGRTDCC